MPNKAAAGAGTIRKKTVTRNGKQYSFWEARITTGKDGRGRQIQRSFSGKTQKEVREKMQAAAVEITDGAYIAPAKMTVGDWLDAWSGEYLNSVKPMTAESYKKNIRVHIKPALGAVKLSALSAVDVQKFYNALVRDGYTVTRTVSGKKVIEQKPLSPKSIKNIHGTLHKALEKAVALGYIKFNPADHPDLPRIEKHEIKPLDDEEINKFLSAIRGHQFETLYTVTLFTGMRQAEVLGLSWDCVDFERGTILVKQQLQQYGMTGGKYVLNTTKNSRWRTIAPAEYVMKLLRHRQAEQIQDRFKAGSAWDNPLDLVFTNALGGCLCAPTVYTNFKKIAASIGLPAARFHDLRHSYAVAAIRSGDDIKTVQENLGHHTAAFTLDVYGHVTEQMKRESAARMDAFITTLKEAKNA